MTTELVAIASGIDPAEVRRLVQRIEQLEAMLAEQAERHTAEADLLRQEHATIVGQLEADIESRNERIAELARQVRVYELVDQQENDQ